MVGKVGDMAQALATLRHERARLIDLLDGQPAWHALRQLDAREAGGDPLGAIDGQALKDRLATRLDAAVPGWRALAGLEAAIAALAATPIAADASGTKAPPQVIEEQRPQPAAAATRPKPQPQPTRAGGDPSLTSDAEQRNRSLAQAIGSMQSLSADRASVPSGNLPVLQPADGVELDPKAVLERIRSVDGHRRSIRPKTDNQPAETAATPRSDQTGAAMSPAARLPAAPGGMGVARATASWPPDTGPTAGSYPRLLPPPLPFASQALVAVQAGGVPVVVPVDAAVTDGSGNATPEPSEQDGAARVEALAEELERLMQRNLPARKAPDPSAERAARASAAHAGDFGDFRDEIFLEEAEIEIVPLETSDGASDGIDLAATEGVAHGAREPLTLQLGRSQARRVAEAENHAAYHGIIDEASVEIVRLDEPQSGAAPGSKNDARRPLPLRLVRDD